MKKVILLIFLFSFLFATSKSQSLFDSNKVWSVVECIWLGTGQWCETNNYHFGSDTTVGLFTYKKLIGNPQFGSPIGAREDIIAKKIYFAGSNGDYLAYDFSLNPGDTFTSINGGCIVPMIVDSVDTITLSNGESRKRLFLTSVVWSTDIWIEGIGSLYGLPYIEIYTCSADFYPELICFEENDTVKYHNSNYSGCFYSAINELAKLHSSLSINPNPFIGNTTISTNNSKIKLVDAMVFNSTGQLIRRYNDINNYELNIEKKELNSGIYYIQVTCENGMTQSAKFILQ